MKSEFKASFLKAIKKMEGEQLKAEIKDVILNVESADNIRQIHNLKKLKGHKHYYRIKIVNYVLGLK